ncbi:unnamed protein product [Lampetra planeri]
MDYVRAVLLAAVGAAFMFGWTQVASPSGIFELQIGTFRSPRGELLSGECCDGERDKGGRACAEQCDTFFTVCVRQYQAASSPGRPTPCVLGNASTPVIGGNNFDLNSLSGPNIGRVSIPFRFAWPRAITLILEAWDQDNGTSGGQLIARATYSGLLLPTELWHTELHSGPRAQLEYRVRALCDPHYYSANCTRLCKPRNDYFGHYSCDGLGGKVCIEGWAGPDCKKAICRQGCSAQHGACEVPGECKCQYGWQGSLCDHCVPHPGCVHGSCSKPWECHCQTNWGGLLCDKDLNYCGRHQPCQHGGTCSNTQPDSYECACPDGFSGAECQIVERACLSDPCLNGGTCAETDAAFECACPAGWSGKTCAQDEDECEQSPCAHGGECANQPGGFLCSCPPQWTGRTCLVDADECEDNPCKGNAKFCKNLFGGYYCECLPGWTGHDCDVGVDDCQGRCLNGGTCTAEAERGSRCSCRPGYTGRRCEKPIDGPENCTAAVANRTAGGAAAVPAVAVGDSCRNGGSCVWQAGALRCVCPAGWEGELCERAVSRCDPNPCQNGGQCRDLAGDFSCQCEGEWTGSTCGSSASDCASRPCHNGGTCVDGGDWYLCECAPGFSGPDCRINVNECQSSPCPRGASCVDEINGYRCVCPPGQPDSSCHRPAMELPRPCWPHGEFRAHGSTWSDGCNTCQCVDGWGNCTKVWCGRSSCSLSAVSDPGCPPAHACRPARRRHGCLAGPCQEGAGECVGPPLPPPPADCRPVPPPDGVAERPGCVRLTLRVDRARLPAGTTVEHICADLRLLPGVRDFSWVYSLFVLCERPEGREDAVVVAISTDLSAGSQGDAAVWGAATVLAEAARRRSGERMAAVSDVELNSKRPDHVLLAVVASLLLMLLATAVLLCVWCLRRRQRRRQRRRRKKKSDDDDDDEEPVAAPDGAGRRNNAGAPAAGGQPPAKIHNPIVRHPHAAPPARAVSNKELEMKLKCRTHNSELEQVEIDKLRRPAGKADAESGDGNGLAAAQAAQAECEPLRPNVQPCGQPQILQVTV